jgi:hypothetical protein
MRNWQPAAQVMATATGILAGKRYAEGQVSRSLIRDVTEHDPHVDLFKIESTGECSQERHCVDAAEHSETHRRGTCAQCYKKTTLHETQGREVPCTESKQPSMLRATMLWRRPKAAASAVEHCGVTAL